MSRHALFALVILLFANYFVSSEDRCSNYKDFLENTRARPLAILKSNNTCYWAYEQGPCAKGEWFVLAPNSASGNTTRPGTCTKRTCPENEEDAYTDGYPSIWVEYRGKCLQTDVPNPEFCGNSNTKVYFTEDEDVPTCMETRPTVMKRRGLARWVGKLMGRTMDTE